MKKNKKKNQITLDVHRGWQALITIPSFGAQLAVTAAVSRSLLLLLAGLSSSLFFVVVLVDVSSLPVFRFDDGLALHIVRQ